MFIANREPRNVWFASSRSFLCFDNSLAPGFTGINSRCIMLRLVLRICIFWSKVAVKNNWIEKQCTTKSIIVGPTSEQNCSCCDKISDKYFFPVKFILLCLGSNAICIPVMHASMCQQKETFQLPLKACHDITLYYSTNCNTIQIWSWCSRYPSSVDDGYPAIYVASYVGRKSEVKKCWQKGLKMLRAWKSILLSICWIIKRFPYSLE